MEMLVSPHHPEAADYAESLVDAGLDVAGMRRLEAKEPWRAKPAGFWDAVELEVARIEAIPAPAFYEFASSGEAYDACQCNARIKSGDLLVIKSEGVVGMAWAWPVAISKNAGNLHEAKDHKIIMNDDDMGASADQFRAAVAKVRELGLELHPAFSYPDL